MNPMDMVLARRQGWMALVAMAAMTGEIHIRAQNAPRAVPVEDDAPKAVPFQRGKPPRATIVTEPDAPKPPDPNRPKGPDEDLYDYASLLYERKEYALALESFGQYLQRYPAGRHVPMCLFRIGES